MNEFEVEPLHQLITWPPFPRQWNSSLGRWIYLLSIYEYKKKNTEESTADCGLFMMLVLSKVLMNANQGKNM